MDHLTAETRSALMRKVRVKDTAPEMIVRRMLHRLGFRFRLHRKDLPGKPDIVLPSRRKIVVVNGCFWHGHNCPRGAPPKSRIEFWGPKIASNRLRDEKNARSLEEAGWRTIVVWECETGNSAELQARLLAFLRR
jgi:DNA mismatch endonuclease (patch repair protein)